MKSKEYNCNVVQFIADFQEYVHNNCSKTLEKNFLIKFQLCLALLNAVRLY